MSQGLAAAGRALGWSGPLQWHHELVEQPCCGLQVPIGKGWRELCLIQRHSMDRWTNIQSIHSHTYIYMDRHHT